MVQVPRFGRLRIPERLTQRWRVRLRAQRRWWRARWRASAGSDVLFPTEGAGMVAVETLAGGGTLGSAPAESGNTLAILFSNSTAVAEFDSAGKLRVDGRTDAGARNLLQACAQAVRKKLDPGAHAFRPDAVMEVNRRVEGGQKRHIPSPALHEAVHSILMVIPFEAIESRPKPILLFARDVEHAVAGRREQPFVRA